MGGHVHREYLFIGKPCDVAAVRQMQQHDPRLKENIPYIVSFMCAGTPSLQGTEQVLDKLEVERKDVTAFRYRGDGWPGLTKATLKNGDERTMTYNDSWGKVLNRHLQTRCKICPDGIGEFADIVCADGWEGDEKGYPSFEEREGNSLILVRTAKAANFFATRPMVLSKRRRSIRAASSPSSRSSTTAARRFFRGCWP